MGVSYKTTRGGSRGFSFEEAVLKGLGQDGGLFIPDHIPQLPNQWKSKWKDLSFEGLAFEIMSMFVPETEMPRDDLRDLINRSYQTFRDPTRTPLRAPDPRKNLYLLELFHGPTYAFKDVALQFLGNLFEYFLVRKNEKQGSMAARESLTVLGATSGDTGSAAIYGLRGKKDVSVFILHPKGRVSPIQEAQMTTVLDANVHNVAVEGTFDDCQDIVKALFNDAEFNRSFKLGAVNSINWARILAQITYYFASWFELQKSHPDEVQIRYVVPTGNFGDILAGYYAKKMGLPIERLVVSTNANDILDRFFRTGVYEKSSSNNAATDSVPAADGAKADPDGAKETLSPAMDILVSSNFERLLWYLVRECDAKDDTEASAQIKGWMTTLKTKGIRVSDATLKAAQRDFVSEMVDDSQTINTIRRYYDRGQDSYVLDPHTAVGVEAAERMISQDPRKSIYTIALATAHPAKFNSAVDMSLRDIQGYNFDQVLPKEFRGLLEKERRTEYIERADPELVKQLIIRKLS